MPTRREWFNTVADKTIRDGLLRNGGNLDYEASSLEGAIDESFIWLYSQEGDDYRRSIYHSVLYGTLKLRKILNYDL